MPLALMILGLVSGIKQMQSGNKIGGMLSGLSSIYKADNIFNVDTPTYNNVMSDSGARRNYL